MRSTSTIQSIGARVGPRAGVLLGTDVPTTGPIWTTPVSVDSNDANHTQELSSFVTSAAYASADNLILLQTIRKKQVFVAA